MLVGEAHGAMHLMGDRGTGAGRLAAAHLGDRDLADRRFPAAAQASAAASAAALAAATSPAKHREVVLDRLELGDRAPELRAVERVLDRLFEDLFERAGHLLQPHGGAES